MYASFHRILYDDHHQLGNICGEIKITFHADTIYSCDIHILIDPSVCNIYAIEYISLNEMRSIHSVLNYGNYG